MLNESQINTAKNLQLANLPEHCIWSGSIVRTKMLTMINTLAGDKDVNILDVGCGTAQMWAPMLQAKPNISLYGFDPSSSAVEKANKTLKGYSANINVGDVRSLNSIFPEVREFDLVVSHSVLEHVVPRGIYFSSISERLKDEGVALISWGSDHFNQGVRTDLRNIISQVLAVFGVEQYYAKKVDDSWARNKIQEAGLTIQMLYHHSLVEIKKLMRLLSEEEKLPAFQRWIGIEESLNRSAPGNTRLTEKMDEAFSILSK